MVSQHDLSEMELLLLTTPDDTEDVPWMVMPDFQWRIVELLMSILRLHARRQGLRWYLAAELQVTMPRALTPRTRTRRTLDVVPDLLMAEADDVERTSWNLQAEGQPPLLVLEVVTEASLDRDMEEKPVIYDALGVREYVIFAPKRTDGGPLLSGYHRLEGGEFAPWSVDEQGALRSAALGGLALYVEDGKWLRVRDAQGQRLPSPDEEAARAEREATRANQEAARAEREAARAEREAAARQAAEAELARLRALLQRDG